MTIGPVYPQAWQTYLPGNSQISELLEKLMFGLPHLGQKTLAGFRRFSVLSTSRMSRRNSIVSLHLQCRKLLEFDVVFRIAVFHQKLTNSFPVVSLKHDLTILRCAAARTETFEFFGHPRQIRVLLVYAVYYRRWFAKFACLKAYPDALLLFFYLNTSAQVFR